MAAYKALVSFSGSISMAAGEVREITDPAIVKDLTRAGYIEEIKAAQTTRKRRTAKKN